MPVWVNRAQMPSAPSSAADDLSRPVGGDLAPWEALGRRERERDGGVDVTARDLAQRVDERGDDEAEGERDAEQVGPVIAGVVSPASTSVATTEPGPTRTSSAVRASPRGRAGK